MVWLWAEQNPGFGNVVSSHFILALTILLGLCGNFPSLKQLQMRFLRTHSASQNLDSWVLCMWLKLLMSLCDIQFVSILQKHDSGFLPGFLLALMGSGVLSALAGIITGCVRITACQIPPPFSSSCQSCQSLQICAWATYCRWGEMSLTEICFYTPSNLLHSHKVLVLEPNSWIFQQLMQLLVWLSAAVGWCGC